ncbi:MAG: Na/Pi symporter [bacterium]|nr:Na/Pi symporter [bacterium]
MAAIQTTFEILGSLGIFFFGLKVLSESILRLESNGLRRALHLLTKNRFGGVFTGFLITALIQSSSATTVLVVSFVHAQLLKLREAVAVIMGANLGTTVTFWVVALLGFKFKITLLVMPAIALGAPLLFSKDERKRGWGESLIGFGLLFLGLDMLKGAIPDIASNPEGMAFLAEYTGYGYGSYLFFVLIGIVLTVVVQSSSAAGAITMIMAYRGWIDFSIAASIVMGENIGTTITAHLASLNASNTAKRAARAHFLFNVIGMSWMLLVFPFYLDLVDWIVPGPVSDSSLIPIHLAAYHSLFKLTNICLLIGFLPQLVHWTKFMVPRQETPASQQEGVILEDAASQIQEMSHLVVHMFERFEAALTAPDHELQQDLQEARNEEYLTDRIQENVSKQLIQNSFGLVARQLMLALVDLRILDQLESIGDRLLKLVHNLNRKHEKQITLQELPRLIELSAQVKLWLAQCTANIALGRCELSDDQLEQMSAQLDQLEANAPAEREDPTEDKITQALWRNLVKIGQACLRLNQTLRPR